MLIMNLGNFIIAVSSTMGLAIRTPVFDNNLPEAITVLAHNVFSMPNGSSFDSLLGNVYKYTQNIILLLFQSCMMLSTYT